MKGFGGKKGKTDKYQITAARCVGINHSDTIICVGMKLGAVMVITSDPTKNDLNMQKLKVIQQSKRWISEIKFSPNDEQVAIGAHDQKIYMYKCTGQRKFKNVKRPMLKHSSAITHIDWTDDSQNIQSNCQAYEILFWDANSQIQNPSGASALKNTNWHTWTCTIGFRVQEIWRGTEDGTDVNAVDRSHGMVLDNKDKYHLMARADDFGKVSIYKDPIVISGQEYNEFGGHSSHVTSCRFSQRDTHLFTTGGEDQCVMQWAVRANMPSQGSVEQHDDDADDDEEGYGEDGEEVYDDDDDEDEDLDDQDDDEVDHEMEGIQTKKVSSKRRRQKYVDEDDD